MPEPPGFMLWSAKVSLCTCTRNRLCLRKSVQFYSGRVFASDSFALPCATAGAAAKGEMAGGSYATRRDHMALGRLREELLQVKYPAVDQKHDHHNCPMRKYFFIYPKAVQSHDMLDPAAKV